MKYEMSPRVFTNKHSEFHNMVKLLWQLGRRHLTDEDGVSMPAALRLLGEVHSSKKLWPGLFYKTFVVCKYDKTRAYFQFC
jgi:hypothetical protein